MSSRWILRTVVLAMALALPALAYAQTSRIEGMAIQGDYIKDYTAIYSYPSQLPNVGNLVYGEMGFTNSAFGSPVDRGVGFVLGNLWDGRFGTWALHMREITPQLGQGDVTSSSAPGSWGSDPNVNANEAFDLMWGKQFGTTSLGLRLNRSYFRSKDVLPGVMTDILELDPFGAAVTGNPNLARNILGLGGGLGFEMNPNTMVEFSFLYQSRTFEASTTDQVTGVTTKVEEDAPTSYMVSARAMWQWQPNVVVTPVFKWYSYDLSTSASVTGGTTTVADNTLKGWQVGAAGNWTLGTNDLFVVGVTFAQNKLDQEEDVFGLGIGDDVEVTETLAPQVFAALETHVNNWLTLRFGANKGAFETLEAKDRTTDEDIDVSLSSFTMMLGAGVKLGTLQLDAVLNDSFPQTLGGFWSQASNYISFPKVTATYAF